MANGRGTRWGNHMGIQKHLINVDGESLLQRIVRQVRSLDSTAEIIISSSNPCYEVFGARRYEPLRNEIELDRFVPELISDEICFLYGDTYYSDASMREIVEHEVSGVHFYGDLRSIIAVKSTNQSDLRHHLQRVRKLYLEGLIDNCIGWQLYQSVSNLPFTEKTITEKFLLVTGATGFNTPAEFHRFMQNHRLCSKSKVLQFI